MGRLTRFAESDELARLESNAVAASEVSELANIPGSDTDEKGGAKKKGRGRRNRSTPPQRTPEEIEIIRAERAAKRALTGAPPHVDGGARKRKDNRE